MYISIILATFGTVFLRGIQQLNTVGGHYIMAAITSYAIAFFEVSFLVSVVAVGKESILSVGTGGALGVTAAMFLHPKIRGLINV